MIWAFRFPGKRVNGINALVSAKTMQGINGNTVYALPFDRLQEILKKYNRLQQ